MHANIAAYIAALDECNHRAAIVMQAQPQLPGTLASLHVTRRREVLLEVSLDARGEVTFVKTLEQVHNRDLDTAAVRSAYASRFSPAMQGCKPRAGAAFFRVVYDPAQE